MTIVKIKQRGITADAVTTSEIAPNTITAADIAPATITTSQIGPGAVAQSNISPAVTLSVPAVTSDPPSPDEGDVWLRTDEKKFKAYLLGTAAWSSAPTPSYGAASWSSNGTSSNSVTSLCGYGSHPRTGGDNGARGNDHLEFNGTSWSNQSNFPYYNSGVSNAGTQSAGIAGGGHGNPAGPNAPIHPSYSATTISQEYDGSSWGSSASLNYAASSMKQQHGHGTQTDNMLCGGWNGPSQQTVTQNYDGSAWSAGDAMPTGSHYVASAGPTNNLLIFSGAYGTASAIYNGSSWSAGPSMSVNRQNECSRMGTVNGPGNTGVLAFGGEYPSNSNVSELYNGTSWASDVALSASPAYGSGDAGHAGSGNTGGGTSTGIAHGGGSPPYPASLSAEYTGQAFAVLSQPAFS